LKDQLSPGERRTGDSYILHKQVSLFVLIILLLTTQLALSYFGQSVFPGISHTGGFIYLLSALIVVLIIIKFLSQL
jgi:hypothetical protein